MGQKPSKCQLEKRKIDLKQQDKELHDDDKRRITDLEQQNKELRDENKKLVAELEEQKKKLQNERDIAVRCAMTERISELEQQVNVLRTENKKIKELEQQVNVLRTENNLVLRRAMAVYVTLDQDTINPYLRVSEDGRSVRWTEQRQNLTDTPERFDKEPYILGKRPEGIVWGYYWEVDVKNKKYWELGVAKDSVLRKGRITLSPKSGFFVLSLWNGKTLEALTEPETPPKSVTIPKIVGVHVDYREMKVSFYNTEDHSHIYTFEENIDKTVRPFFSPGNRDQDPLIISAPELSD